MTLTMEAAKPRIAAVGGKPSVLKVITDEIAEAGLSATGFTIEQALAGVEGEYDLVSFGGGVTPDLRRTLEQQIRRRSPGARFIRTFAPYAASQIIAAARSQDRPAPIDLDAYCRRIGYAGPREATIATLGALQEHHIAAIAFEALDVLTGRGVDLAPATLDAKLLHRRRGGYCFEQNSLFQRVLAAIGFDVRGHLARVRWNAQPGTPPPSLTHLTLRVEIDGVPWHADVGFGASVPTAPLRLDLLDEQPTRHDVYRTLPFGSGTLIQAKAAGVWRSLYDVSGDPALEGHYEPANWFTSTHPSSLFKHHLIVARTSLDARYALLDDRLTIRPSTGAVERHQLDARGIEWALEALFLLDVEDSWKAAIERAAGA